MTESRPWFGALNYSSARLTNGLTIVGGHYYLHSGLVQIIA